MTQEEYCALIDDAEEKFYGDVKLRRGQWYMILLHKKYPNIARELVGTEADCFYVDNNLNTMLKVIAKQVKD